MADKFTPGPWGIESERRVDADLTLCRIESQSIGYIIAESVDKLDAPAICAVPELVEALRGLLEKHIAHHNAIEHAAARALLAKIDGEAA